ncbi:MAG: amino acid ABC transporter permease [Lachnospiraceae bacterium]
MDGFIKILNFKDLLLQGFGVTLLLSLVIILGGTALGLIVASCYTMNNKILNKILAVYTYIFRGTPLLLQLFVGYFGLGYLGLEMSIWSACGIIMSMYAGAYISEVFRAGLESIPKGQYEAAKSLNLSKLDTLVLVILPQVFRKIMPSLIGVYLGLIKDTTIASLVGFNEFMKRAKIVINNTNLPLQVYFVVAIVFFLICFPISKIVSGMEEKGRVRQ